MTDMNLIGNQTPLMVVGGLSKQQMAPFASTPSGFVAKMEANASGFGLGPSATLQDLKNSYLGANQGQKASAIQILDTYETNLNVSQMNPSGPLPILITSVSNKDITSGMSKMDKAAFGPSATAGNIMNFLTSIASATTAAGIGVSGFTSLENEAEYLFGQAEIASRQQHHHHSSASMQLDKLGTAISDLNAYKEIQGGWQPSLASGILSGLTSGS